MEVTAIKIDEDDFAIEHGARNCYGSFDRLGSDPNFIGRLIKRTHLGVLEHCSATFYVRGMSRACSHQLVRHRHFSYLQKSQRYVKELQFTYVTPQSIHDNPAAKQDYDDMMVSIQRMYDSFVGYHKIKKEDARYILPNACHTDIQITGNFLCWLEMLRKRFTKHAQWEVRDMSRDIYSQLNAIHPHIFNEETVGFPVDHIF